MAVVLPSFSSDANPGPDTFYLTSEWADLSSVNMSLPSPGAQLSLSSWNFRSCMAMTSSTDLRVQRCRTDREAGVEASHGSFKTIVDKVSVRPRLA